MEVFNETMETMDTEQESLPEAIKEVVDAVTDAIIEKEVDEKFKGEQMKENKLSYNEMMEAMIEVAKANMDLDKIEDEEYGYAIVLKNIKNNYFFTIGWKF